MFQRILFATFLFTIGCGATSQAPAFRPAPPMVPPTPPLFPGFAATGVTPPFANSARIFRVENLARIQGDRYRPLLVTAVFVNKVRYPLWSLQGPVPWVPYGETFFVHLPPCQFLDGSPRCEPEIEVQLNGWAYDLMSNQIPADSVVCAKVQQSAYEGGTTVNWNDRTDRTDCVPKVRKNKKPVVAAMKP